jgi:TP901 family phage tail tape measure protein
VPLPPVTQVYTADAAAYLATLDEMIAATDRLAGTIDRVNLATARMSGSADEVAAADARIDEAATAANEAIARQGELMQGLVASSDELVAAVDEATAAIDRENVALDATSASAAKADESAAAAGGHGKVAFLALAAAVGYSVVQAAKFQEEMTRLQTAAGLTNVNMKSLSSQVLQLGDKTGYTGTQLAEALYHPISAGLNLATSLKLVANAAELAQIHGASLEDTTYALSSIMKAYNQSAGDAGKTSSLLNAIVGQGDMRFQDFVQSVQSWAPTGASMGISIHSMGAALAYLTDRGNSAETAATRLTMGLSMVTSPSKEASTFLGALGLEAGSVTLKSKSLADVMNHYGVTTSKVAADLKKPDGIFVALTQVKGAFEHAGLSASQANAVMAKIFGGGRSDKAILSLMQNLDGVRTKYESIGKASDSFGSSWAKTQKTVSFEFHQTVASVQNLAISFGSVLLPAVEKCLSGLEKAMQFLQKNPALAAFAGALIAVGVAFKLAAGAEALFDAASDANSVMLVLLAVIALAAGLYELYKHCKAVRDAVADVVSFFKSAWTSTLHAAGAVINWFVSGPLAFIKQELSAFSKFWKQNGQEIDKIVRAFWTLIAGVFKTYWDMISGVFKAAFDVFIGLWRAGWAIISGLVKMAWNLIAETIKTGVQFFLDIIGAFLQLLQGHWKNAWNDLKNATSTLLTGLGSMIKTVLGGFVSIVFNAGKDLISGFVNGIKSMFGSVMSVVSDLANTVTSTLKSALKIFSPSKVMVEIGQYIGDGLVQGLEGTKAQVKAASDKIATLVRDAFSAKLIGAGTYTSLTDYITRDNARLQTLASKRASILSEIATAKKYAATTTTNTESWAGLSNLTAVSNASNGGALYSGDMLSGLQANLSQIRQFESALKKLTKLGLDKNLLNQIIQMGPAQGLQVANALLEGPVSVIKQMDQTQTAINSASSWLGKTAADEMYDSGKQAGKGFLSGLEGQQKAIEKLMKKIADSMVSTIRKELGISSPSKVARYHGQMWSEGLALGIEDGGDRIAASAKKTTSALTGGIRGGASGAGGAAVVNNYFQPRLELNGVIATDKRELQAMLWPLLQQAALQFNKRNGGTNNGLSLASGRFG